MAAKNCWQNLMKIKDTVIYIPYYVKGDKNNAYTFNMIKLLKEKFIVAGSLAEPADVLRLLRTKAVFLNWIEADLDYKMKMQLLFHKLTGAKIVWVFHNKYPHDAALSRRIVQNMKWLARYSSIIMLHSKSSRKYIPNAARNKKKSVYIPHVLYEQQIRKNDIATIKAEYGICNADFVFTIFGMVRPYKNIEGAIEAFKKLNLNNARLLIAGNPVNKKYAEKITRLCKEENIILDLKYLSNYKLDCVLEISDVIVIPYKDRSSMNSGVMIHAFSKGKTVIAPDICMARDMAANNFFYMHHGFLKKTMAKAYENGKDMNRKMGEKAQDYILKYNNHKIVREALDNILC